MSADRSTPSAIEGSTPMTDALDIPGRDATDIDRTDWRTLYDHAEKLERELSHMTQAMREWRDLHIETRGIPSSVAPHSREVEEALIVAKHWAAKEPAKWPHNEEPPPLIAATNVAILQARALLELALRPSTAPSKAEQLGEAVLASIANQPVTVQLVDGVPRIELQPPSTERTSLEQFNELCQPDTTPLERLRFFCSLAMNGQDWLDVEPFFDAVERELRPTTKDTIMEKQFDALKAFVERRGFAEGASGQLSAHLRIVSGQIPYALQDLIWQVIKRLEEVSKLEEETAVVNEFWTRGTCRPDIGLASINFDKGGGIVNLPWPKNPDGSVRTRCLRCGADWNSGQLKEEK